MRYIDLRDNTESYFDSVLKLGCGPNYVRNRSTLFEQMIQEQGKEFWFRFWLNFSLQPEIKEIEEFSEVLPILTTSLCQLLHNRFVQASNEAAIAYCWDIVFEKPTPVAVTEIILADGQFIDESYQYVVVNFACALGEVFCKWLRAKEVGNFKLEYWTVPAEYLTETFKPTKLEKFMIQHWGKNLIELFEVSKNQVPWIRKYLLKPETFIDRREKCVYSNTDCLRTKAVARKLRSWALKVRKIRSAIKEVDEKLILVSSLEKPELPIGGNERKSEIFDIPNTKQCSKTMSEMIIIEKKSSVQSLAPRGTDKLIKKKKIISKVGAMTKKKTEDVNQVKCDYQLKKRKKLIHKISSQQTEVEDAATSTDFDIRVEDSWTNTESLCNSESRIRTDIIPIKDEIQLKLRKCSACDATSHCKMKKCQQCADEKWHHPRYYCNIVCQTKDWFQRHEREHNMFSMKNMNQFLAKYNDVVSKVSTRISPRSNASCTSISLDNRCTS